MTCILSHDNCFFSVVKLCHRFFPVDCGAVRRVIGVVFSLSLSQYHRHSLSADQRNIIWNSRRGFTIRSPTFFYIGLFFCRTTGDEVRHQSRSYFVHRIGQQALSPPLYKSRVNMYVCINVFCAKSLIFYSFFVSVNKIKDVRLNSSEHTQALKGQRLVLNCSATAELNTRVNFTWDYPGKVRATLQSLEIKEAQV